MSELYALLALFIFLGGICIGGFISLFAIMKNELVIEPVYVDIDEDGIKRANKQKGFFIRKKKENEEKDILDYRLIANKSTLEQKCEEEGVNIADVLEKQQDKVDNDFEYLSKK